MEATALTSVAIDVEYGKVCSRIGELYCERETLLDRLEAATTALDELALKRTLLQGQYAAVKRNEDAAVGVPAPLASVTHE